MLVVSREYKIAYRAHTVELAAPHRGSEAIPGGRGKSSLRATQYL